MRNKLTNFNIIIIVNKEIIVIIKIVRFGQI